MAFNISYIYKAVDRFTPVARKIKSSVDSISSKANQASLSIRNMGENIGKTGAKMFAFVSLPLSALGMGMLKASATMEQMQISFESMLGSTDKAKALMKDLVTFAAKTPFELVGIGKATKQLLAFGIKQEDIVDNLQVLGDIAAGSGASLTEMAAIFGKVKAKGKAMTEEILQLSDRGIPIIDVLSKKYGKSGDKILEAASKSKLSFKIISDALRDMTQKGGIFNKQMIKQSSTLAGLFSTLSDVIYNASAVMGDNIVATTDLKDRMVKLAEWVEKITAKFEALSPETKKFIVYAGLATIVIAPLIIALSVLVLSLGFLLKGIVVLLLPIRLLFTGIGLLYRAFVVLKVGAILFGAASRIAAIGIAAMSLPIIALIASLTAAHFLIKKVKKDFAGLNQGKKVRENIQKDIDAMNAKTKFILENKAKGEMSINRNNKTTLEGDIVVRALQGTSVERTQMSTKGSNSNLGMSLAGAY